MGVYEQIDRIEAILPMVRDAVLEDETDVEVKAELEAKLKAIEAAIPIWRERFAACKLTITMLNTIQKISKQFEDFYAGMCISEAMGDITNPQNNT